MWRVCVLLTHLLFAFVNFYGSSNKKTKGNFCDHSALWSHKRWIQNDSLIVTATRDIATSWKVLVSISRLEQNYFIYIVSQYSLPAITTLGSLRVPWPSNCLSVCLSIFTVFIQSDLIRCVQFLASPFAPRQCDTSIRKQA